MSGSNVQKTPYVQSFNAAVKARALDQIALTGRGIPCTVVSVNLPLVTVSFQLQAVNGLAAITIPNVEMPIAESQYVRLPIQPGDQGMTIAADYAIGGVTGMGSGVATTAIPPNLSALAFEPLGNTNFPTSIGPFSVSGQQLVLNGPSGVMTLDASGQNVVNVTTTNVNIVAKTEVTISVGSKTIIITSSGITLDGIPWDTHTHTYSPGTGTPTETGPPV